MATTEIKIVFDYEMKTSTVIPANIEVISNTPNVITGTIAEDSVWNGVTHKFIWTCSDNGEALGGGELDPTRSFTMKFDSAVLDVLGLHTEIPDKIFGTV